MDYLFLKFNTFFLFLFQYFNWKFKKNNNIFWTIKERELYL